MRQPFQGTVLRDMETGQQWRWDHCPTSLEILARVGPENLTAQRAAGKLPQLATGGSPKK
jgi:hypothetical protein